MSVFPYLLAGVVVLVGSVTLYFGRGGVLPSSPEDWANFGTYAGGIAGPLLSFVALIAIVRTMQLQRETLDLDRQRQLADQHLRWLDALYKDMKEALEARVSEGVTLRALLDRDVEADKVERQRLTARLDNLMQLLASYCQAVHLYRDNISAFYDLQIYADRGGRLLDAMKPFHSYLGNMIGPTIELCDLNLRGETERREPVALTRSSRRP